MNPTPLSAVIFDMDGVLIDSEPRWQIAELEVLGKLGVPISLADTLQTTGLRVDQLVEFWYRRHPWSNYDNQATAQAIVDRVAAAILTDGEPLPGVVEALTACQKRGLKIGLATSSPTQLIRAVMQKLAIGHYFDAFCSAESLTWGKPHPEVYLNCAKTLQVAPEHCIAVEDSFNGVIAARAANMHTLVIPAVHESSQARWAAAHQQLEDLTQLNAYLQQCLG
ncbi:hexitol phosphatase HxpB [Shewanella sp. AS1]|uniref:hexitol phosphatase HxpB n=1 Tax=Shewanella sp. AS1 TaxID=2907626 RepID=UPI001F1814CF|nr:hexitol phosphatase HxpB [Shewanella sp. AS1]MCE9679899.1 hexitol phosphatase HxpB [Shewanella sp. AS1]